MSDGPALVLDDALVPWTVRGYTSAHPRPGSGVATIITPPSTVAALRVGYQPQIDSTAQSHGDHGRQAREGDRL